MGDVYVIKLANWNAIVMHTLSFTIPLGQNIAVTSCKRRGVSSFHYLHWLLNSLLRLLTNEILNFCVTGLLSGESTGDLWIPHTNGQ